MTHRDGTTSVHLRDVVDEDLDIFFEHQNDPESNEMAAFPPRDRDEHMAHWHKILADDGCMTKTIVSDGEVAGNIGSWVQDGHREIGYWVGRRHWGRGIATAAVARLIEIVTERPLYGWVAEHNAASIRVLERCGFTRSAEQPEAEPGRVRYVVLELGPTPPDPRDDAPA